MKKTAALSVAALAAVGILVAGLVAVLVGCSSQGLGNNANCDYTMAVGLKDGGVGFLTTDRQCPVAGRVDFGIQIDVRSPAGGAGGLPDPTSLQTFVVSRYEITYRNLTTGGTVPGVDVPFPLTQLISALADIPPTLLELDGIPVIEPGAKERAPLNDSNFYPVGGVRLEARMTWWGYPIGDQDAECFQDMSWSFTVFDSGPRPTDPGSLEEFLSTCS